MKKRYFIIPILLLATYFIYQKNNIPSTFDEVAKKWFLEKSNIKGRLGLLK
jgi:hypothetical protein